MIPLMPNGDVLPAVAASVFHLQSGPLSLL